MRCSNWKCSFQCEILHTSIEGNAKKKKKLTEHWKQEQVTHYQVKMKAGIHSPTYTALPVRSFTLMTLYFIPLACQPAEITHPTLLQYFIDGHYIINWRGFKNNCRSPSILPIFKVNT